MVDLTRRNKKSGSKIVENDSSDDNNKILRAIAAQRWFFFSNNPYIIFDRNSALIWTKPSYFPWQKSFGEYSHAKSYSEVQNLVIEMNSKQFGDFKGWRIPYPNELWQLVEDKTFPFRQGNNWRIQNEPRWCVYYSKFDRETWAGKNLDSKGSYADISTNRSVNVILCSSNFVPSNYSATPKEILDIFIKNSLVPMFDDKLINELYEEFVSGKSSRKKSVAKLDYRTLIKNYDISDVKKSAIQYFDAVLSITDELLNVLQEYEAAQAETIAECLKIALKLNAKYTDNPNLTAEENKLLAERQKYLAKRLELGTNTPKKKILSVKLQAEQFFERLDEINNCEKSLQILAAVQNEPRPNFEFLVENLARIINDAQRKVDFFTENKNFVADVVKSQSDWSDSYKSFKTSLREELSAACRNESIDDEIFSAWYNDWQTKRFIIEQRFLPLVEFGLKGNFSDAFNSILIILRDYRDAVDKFYLNERKNIYQKFAFTSGGDLQEKFETESELYKLSEKLQRDLHGIIFSRDKSEERIFLLNWSEPLLNLPIDEISKFIVDKELDEISSEVLTSFSELRSKNFAEYLADSKSYIDAVQKREKEFNALIFRMRKDLRKK